MIAIRLQTEFMVDPLGIDIRRPRLQWNCAEGIRQTAYQLVATAEDGAILWDTGKILESSMHTIWNGVPLKSRDFVCWRVRLWDEKDIVGAWSETATFSMGLLEAGDWSARWISGDYTPRKKKRYPVDCFRKKFSVSTARKATLYATACGLYEIQLNGKKAGDHILAPGHTDYRKRIQYQTIDVTDLLCAGENVMTAELADGWYRGSTGAWGLRNQYGTQTKLIVQLEIALEDGTLQIICTDDSWGWSNDGPIRFADNKDGERVDAQRKPSYSGHARTASCDVIPTASNNVPIREKERFCAKKITTPSGKQLFDFGQNIAGYAEFHIAAQEGQTATLRFGEMLDARGELTLKNIQCTKKNFASPLQQVDYICQNGLNYYKTKFSVFGFRYIEVTSDLMFSEADITAIAVYSDMEQTVTFESSNALLNRFLNCTVWSAKGNSADVPTDCPTRERHGWTGDAQVFSGTAAYLFNYYPFARKYIQDVFDWQKPSGCLPQIAPSGGVDFYMKVMDGAVGWADAGVLIPYRMWKQYGDIRILENHYDGMKKYARFMQNRCGKWYFTAVPTGLKRKDRKYISNCGQAFGEWLEPEEIHAMHWTDAAVTHPEEATAYTGLIMGYMEEIAQVLGKADDATHFHEWAENTKQAYQLLVRQNRYSLDTDRQAKLVRPLAFELLDEEQTEYAQKRLIQALENFGWRLGTGFLSTPLILDVLTEINPEYAYRLLENEEIPGWLSMPKQGATTIWESWEGLNAAGSVSSLNHYSKGAVCEWVFRVMCGISVAGENRFRIAPIPGGKFQFASTCYRSVYGEVSCGWVRNDDSSYAVTVTVPANCSAEIVLPGMETVIQQAGTKQYIAERRSSNE